MSPSHTDIVKTTASAAVLRNPGSRPAIITGLRSGCWLSTLALTLWWSGHSATAAESIALTVVERSGVSREHEPITSGIPFPKGDLRSVEQVRLVCDGHEVPAQFRAAGWWRPDDSIRWLLVDFQADLAARARQTYTLEYGEGVSAKAKPAAEIRLEETADGFVVNTGVARFDVNRKVFDLFREVSLTDGTVIVPRSDASKPRFGAVLQGLKPLVTRALPDPANQGHSHLIHVVCSPAAGLEDYTLRFSSDREFEVTGAQSGPVGRGAYLQDFTSQDGLVSIPSSAWLNYAYPQTGDVYRFRTIPAGGSAVSESVWDATVLERGPLRSVIRFKGSLGPAHAPVLEFTAWYHFYAGSGRVKLAFTLENNQHGGRTSDGNADNANIGGINCVFFDSMQLRLPLQFDGAGRICLGGSAERRPFTAPLFTAVELYQDSSGGEHWNRYQAPEFHPRPNSYVQFKGHRMVAGREQVEAGNRALGWLDLSDTAKGLTVSVADFWQNYPKGLSADAEGTVQIDLFPGRYAADFPLRSGEHKTHELLFYFHPGPAPDDGHLALARALSDPLRLEPSPEWFARTRALDDLHPFDMKQHRAYEVRNLSSLGQYPRGVPAGPSVLSRREEHEFYGWMDYGDVPTDFESPSGQWGMKYDLDYFLAQQWARSLHPTWWNLFVAADRHTRDIDIHHQPHHPGLHFVKGGVWAHSLHDEPGDENPHRNRNHFTKDLCFGARGTATLYYLTGDWKAHDSCLEIAENALAQYMSPQGDPGPPERNNRMGSRGDGGTLQRLLEGYVLSGDDRFLQHARWQVQSCAFDGRPAKHEPISLWSSLFYMEALARYVQLFPEDAAARAYLLAHTETLRKAIDPENGIFYTITPQPDGSVVGTGDCSHYNIMAADMLAIAHRLTGRADYLEAARRCFAYGVQHANGRDGGPTYYQIHSANGAMHGNAFMAIDAASLTKGEPQFLQATDPQTGWLTSLRCAADINRVEFLRAGQSLGAVTLRVRAPSAPWREIGQSTPDVALSSGFQPQGEALVWEIRVKNAGGQALEIGDLALPLPMNTDFVWDHEETFMRRVFRHAFIAQHGSFLYWLPVQGTGPCLVMQPLDGASLEFFTATDMDYAHGREQFTVFVHSRATAELDPRGTWRGPRTSQTLEPGEEVVIRFAFRWADHYEGVRELIYRHGAVDVQVIPGMVVPRDLTAMIALRTQRKIDALSPEFPTDTTLEYLGQRAADTHCYRVKFSKLGENLLTIHAGGGYTMPLEFFVTEPLETLIKKRSAFIVKHQQHRNPTKWYDGLYSLWDRHQPQGLNLLGPDHLGGQPPYAVSGSDDPSNGKGLLVAEKNVAFPDADEVASLEYFVKHFVWGKHQRTDSETPYPYGIYGADSWQQNRFTDRDPLDQGISRPGGPSACRMWRTFDYTTYFALYFDLYRIAKQRPDLVQECTAAEYLERAYGTARAYFEVPAKIRMEGGWSFTGWVYWQYTVGNFHEKYLLPLIAALEAEGRQADADVLRAEWEKKVKYFIYDHPWPFASEMPIDSTAYESTYAAGRYALEYGLKPDTNLWHDRNLNQWFSHPVIDPTRHEEFLLRQHRANLACRGVLEANYWSLGSDFRGCGSASYTLSYMSQMGGWAVLDYALRFDPNPAANLRLGYASMLSSWALINSGDAQSDFGYWTPGSLHDGAMSWGFQPRQVGSEWNPAMRDLSRGAWPVCGEADHGLVAGIEAASTVLCDDPLFGLIAFGGEVTRTNDLIGVIPRDGVRQRFHALLGGRRLHLALERDGFAADQPIQVSPALDRLSFTLESRAPSPHETTLAIEGLPSGQYAVSTGSVVRRLRAEGQRVTSIQLPVAPGQATAVQIDVISSDSEKGTSDRPTADWTMGPFVKHRTPVLSPTPDSTFQCPVLGKEVRWEEQNVYNPAAVVRNGKVYLFYRADDKNSALKWGRTCRIGMAWSEDGIRFTRHPTPVLYPDNDAWKTYEWEGGCEDLHIVEGEDGVCYMNYTTWNGHSDTVSIASSRDLLHWTKHGPAFAQAGQIGGRSGVVVSRRVGDRLVAAKIDGKYWMYYTHPCALAWSENLIDWTPTGQAVWPGGGREAGAIALLRDNGILLMTQGGHSTLGAWVLRQALVDRRDLTRVLQEQQEPFLFPEYDWEMRGFTNTTTVANTLVPFQNKWLLYYGGADRHIGLAEFTPGD